MPHFVSLKDLEYSKIRLKNQYLSVEETAIKNKISRTMVYWLLRHNRIEGSVKFGNQYCIPINWNYKKGKSKGKLRRGRKPFVSLENPDPFSKYSV